MSTKHHSIQFTEIKSLDDLSADEKELVNRAIEARNNAYAPYSHFRVGAALRLSDGSIITGSNQENAAYPMGLCAERVALFYAQSQYPGQTIQKIAIAGGLENELTDEPVTPCGACRQVLVEIENRQHQPIEVLMTGQKKTLIVPRGSDLLPLGFSGKILE